MQNPFADGIEARISADTGGFEDAIGGAMGKLSDFKASVGLAGGALAALSAGALAKATQSAIEFESQLADLEKVTSAEMVKPLRQGIMNLSEEIPMARKGLTELAVQAGKFGAESEAEIMGFVESVGKITSATDLAADEAGTRFAKIAGAIGMPMDEIGKLGNAVNSLADSMKTDAGEITDTATRASNILSQQLGLSQDSVLALSASMNEVSSSSRLAASSLRRMAETMMDPRKMADMAAAVGMTKDEFQAMVKTEPEKLMQRLAATMKENGEGADILRSTIGKAANDFNKLASQTEQTAKAQEVVNQQFRNGTSLNREMAIRTDTFSGKMQLLSNKVQNAATRIGDRLLPHLKGLLDVVIRGVEWFGRINDRTDGFAGMVTLLGGVVAGTVAALGSLASVLATSTTAAAGATGAVSALGTAFTVLTGPIGIATAAIAGLYLAWRENLFGIRDRTQEAVSSVRAAFNKHIGPIRAEVEELAQSIRGALLPTFQMVQGFVRQNWPQIRAIGVAVFSTIHDVVSGLADAFLRVARIMLNVVNGDFSEAWSLAKDLVQDTVRGIAEWIQTTGATLVKNSFKLLVNGILAVGGWLKDQLIGAGGLIKSLISSIVTFLQGVGMADVRAAFRVLSKAVLSVGSWLKDQLIGGGGGGIIGDMISSVVAFFKGIGLNDVKAGFRAIGRGIRAVALTFLDVNGVLWNVFTDFFSALVEYLRTDAWGDLKGAAEFLFDILHASAKAVIDSITPSNGLVVQLIDGIVNYLRSDAWSDLKGAAEALFDVIMAAAEGLYQGLIGNSLIPDMFSEIASYIRNQAASDLANAATSAAEKAANALKRAFNNALPDSINVPSVTVGGGSISLPSTTIAGQKVGGGALSIPSETIGGQSLRIPQLDTGGFIEEAGLAMLHAGEQVVPAADVDRGGGGTTIHIERIEANSRQGGRAAARGLADELRSQGFNS